jgi:ribonuclease T2
MITITCKQGYIEEVRLCLSRDLDPVPCGRDVIRDCTAKDALFDPIR